MPALIMSDPIQQSISTINVICAWPVSGQYGPGSRILYYALVAACIIARKAEWLRSPCLAAALLIPAVSALHGVVIAILHVPGAIDMDIYGIFQVCAIGILTAPVTVRLSNTYFNAPGRSIIFLWTAVVLAGLISLAIEFYRTQSQPCTPTDGQPLPSSYETFLNNNITCLNLTCSIADGPFSSLRQGSNNNIYVIPVPDAFKFGTATLLAAACCIPAILDLFSTWNKILDLDWKLHFGSEENPGSEDIDATIEGTNGATVRHMRGITRSLRMVRDGVAAPVFAAAVFAVLILGEKNFWSVQVNWQTEPMQSVGQWAPIVGTGLAVMGSLYMLLAADLKKEREEEALGGRSGDLECHCSPRCRQHRQPQRQRPSTHFSESQSNSEVDSGALTSPDILCQSPSQHSVELRAPSIQEIEGVAELPPKRSAEEDVGSRHKFARTLLWVGHKFGTAAQDRFNMDDFKRGKAKEFPEIPGEENRNPDLRRQRERYNHRRDEDEYPSPSGSGMHTRNRSPSFAGSTRSNLMRSGEEIARTLGTISRNPSTRSTSSISDNFPLEPSPRRGDTLEVPEPVYGRQSNSRRRSNPPVSPVSPISGPAPPSRGRKLGDIRSTSSPHLPHDNVTPMK